ncbi:HlyD family secretion protein [Marinobacter persicus]|uniref:HlyD family secretion protein n=3 Tax=Marinobacter persicus TaxID=930118 RepID=A0A1I3Y026_9GAMM|nr:HlyD family secretion protein [Marinobacter persicus]PPK54500.1 HlyD family secretion protein [Marinobacter persicus]PPK57826.1 HlyD family secretion protein [Marinobacter persicus]GHD52781.1 glycoside hydrolase family 43 [Marinobacter persicus]SFK24596.1 HlyD family secretion protein [Marinobacter persicus]
MKKFMKAGIRGVAAAIVIALGVWAWWHFQPQDLPDGFAAGNGRIEAVEIDIAARTAGRIREILVNEGDFVRAGQVLAKMDTAVLEAQLREAEAQLQRALIGIETAQSLVTQREAEKQAAEAFIAQRKAELDAAQKRLARTRELASKNAASEAQLDDDRAAAAAAKAAVGAAEAQAAAAQAAIGRARSDVIAAEASVEAARATLQRIQADIDDSVLKSPRDGRVQYRVAQPGEVLSPGGVVLNMVDLTDVYMTFFLPTEQAGRIALGAEARLVLDAAPQYVIPTEISFVADVAQFTPKTVETQEERQKLMFRIKARIAPDLLREHLLQVKTGLPGMAYVQLDPRVDWPPELQTRLPQ